MRRIVISLLKGGVAKSETAVSLAFGLAARGRRVLLVDTDVQAHCGDMLGVEPKRGLADLVAGWDSPEGVLEEARENLWLLAGGNELAALKMEIARREMASEAVLSEALEVYEGRFDYLIMDTAPGWDTLLVNALYASQWVLSPVSMEPMALSGLIRFEERLQVIRKYKPELQLRWVVPTFVDGRVRKTAEILEQLKQRYGALVGPRIRYSAKASEAPAFGRTIFEHDPKGSTAKGYSLLIDQVIRDLEERPQPRARVYVEAGDLAEPAPPLRPVPDPPVVEAVETAPAPEPGPSLVRPPEPAPTPEPAPEPGFELTRAGLIEKIMAAKESASHRARVKFSWVIERLESADRNWTQTDLRALEQIIDQMILSDRAQAVAAGPVHAAAEGGEAEGVIPRVSGPLSQRLNRTGPAPDQEAVEMDQARAAEG